MGNEPDWLLEIYSGHKVVFERNPGRDRYLFMPSAPEIDQAGGVTRYRLHSREHRLLVMLREKPCEDTHSGEVFEMTVTIIFDARPLAGCGMSLD